MTPNRDLASARAGKDLEPKGAGGRREYRPPRIAKKRAVSQATLFGGAAPSSAAEPVIGNPG